MTSATLPPPPPSTAHPDRAAMLRQILEHPESDAPRLVFADWLTENGEHRWAEIIRVQCRIQSGGCLSPDLRETPGWEMFAPRDGRGYATNIGPCPDGRGVQFRIESSALGGGEFIARRGFMDEVRMPCAAFMAHAASIFAAHPVTRVVLTCREPMGFSFRDQPTRELYEWRSGDGELRYQLPEPIHQRLPWSSSNNKQSAFQALSAACVSYGRALAGLRPLK